MKNYKELVKNDLFIMRYGFSYEMFRVAKPLRGGVWAHSLKWTKSGSIFISHKELEDAEYYGRMSKLRAFFLL